MPQRLFVSVLTHFQVNYSRIQTVWYTHAFANVTDRVLDYLYSSSNRVSNFDIFAQPSWSSEIVSLTMNDHSSCTMDFPVRVSQCATSELSNNQQREVMKITDMTDSTSVSSGYITLLVEDHDLVTRLKRYVQGYVSKFSEELCATMPFDQNVQYPGLDICHQSYVFGTAYLRAQLPGSGVHSYIFSLKPILTSFRARSSRILS